MTAAPPPYKQNRLKQLRAFCHVARSGNMSETAERLYLSQPTISLQIKALERELDITLFERRGPRIELTPEGEVLYRLAQPLVEGLDRLPDAFAAHFGRLEKGELRIAAGESTILYILPEVVRRYTSSYPGIELELRNVTGREGLALLRADEVDLAVGSLLEVPEDVLYRPTRSHGPALILPEGHPLAVHPEPALADIARYGLILPPRGLSTWRNVEVVFRQNGLTPTVALVAGGWEVIKRYVAEGVGIAIVTDLCLTGDERLVARPLDRYFPRRTYGVIIRRGRYLSPQARRFVEMVDPAFFREEPGAAAPA